MALDAAPIVVELAADEGVRLYVYDDATGKPIVPGSVVVGHPTIGEGRALDVHGISAAEASFLLADDIAAFDAALTAALPCYASLDPVRQRVLVEMAFNLGMVGLLGFRNTLRFVAAQAWNDAADAMLSSNWAIQVGDRALRLAAMMRTGSDPRAA